MRLTAAVVATVALVLSSIKGGGGAFAAAKGEDQLRRRELDVHEKTNQDNRRQTETQGYGPFVRYGPDYGRYDYDRVEDSGRYDYDDSYNHKGSKGGGDYPYGSKSSSKAYGSKGSKSGDYPHGSKGSKDKPDYVDCPKPSPPPMCDYDYDTDEYTCADPHLTCQQRCLPALCEVVPQGPPKVIDGYVVEPTTTYVPIGETCMWWEFARGEPSVCCKEKDSDKYYPPGCTTCQSCSYPQVVSEACCAYYPGPPKIHDPDYVYDDEKDMRTGDYHVCDDYQQCCKCGDHSYKCIPKDKHCGEEVCGYFPPKPTPTPKPYPTPKPMPKPTRYPAPKPTPKPTPYYEPKPTPHYAPKPTPYYAPKPTPYYEPKPTPNYAPKPTPYYAPKPTPYYAPKPTPYYAPKPTPDYPQKIPTHYYTPTPTPAPVDVMPVKPVKPVEPSMPTVMNCKVSVEIECYSDDGTPCDQLQSPEITLDEPECVVPITVSFTANNTGTIDLFIVLFTAYINDEENDLLEYIPSEDLLLNPSETYTYSQDAEIDMCVPTTHRMVVNLGGASTPSVEPQCFTSFNYEFDVEPPGGVPPPGNTEPPEICIQPGEPGGCISGERPGGNNCCNPTHFCDQDNYCVQCLGAGGIGCNSNDEDACCGVELQCAKNSPNSGRLDMNSLPMWARYASDQCCVMNAYEGCTKDEHCCNSHKMAGGYVCREVPSAGSTTVIGKCCIQGGEPVPTTTQGSKLTDHCCFGFTGDTCNGPPT